jgi:hypothetical protein
MYLFAFSEGILQANKVVLKMMPSTLTIVEHEKALSKF